jgi:hypothetical protein
VLPPCSPYAMTPAAPSALSCSCIRLLSCCHLWTNPVRPTLVLLLLLLLLFPLSVLLLFLLLLCQLSLALSPAAGTPGDPDLTSTQPPAWLRLSAKARLDLIPVEPLVNCRHLCLLALAWSVAAADLRLMWCPLQNELQPYLKRTETTTDITDSM